MQDNSITLSVDEDNDGATTADADYEYRNLNRHLFRSDYIHTSDHAVDSRDTLNFYATPAKPTASFKGVQRSSFKFSKDIIVLGPDGVSNVTAPVIVECKFSIPVGATNAQILIERQKALSLLDSDAIMDNLNELMET
jgi:hypothetical protein